MSRRTIEFAIPCSYVTACRVWSSAEACCSSVFPSEETSWLAVASWPILTGGAVALCPAWRLLACEVCELKDAIALTSKSIAGPLLPEPDPLATRTVLRGAEQCQ